MHLKSIVKKTLFVLLVFLFSINVNAQEKGGYSLRINFDGAYNYTPTYDVLLPYSTGIDLGWVMHENLTLYAGLSYWQADHSYMWQTPEYDYYWDSPMVSLLLNASAKFNSPAIKINKRDKLLAFLEPGISIEPVPMAVVSYERIYPFSYYSTPVWDTETRFAAPYFSWNIKAGFSYVVENQGYLELAYTLSSLDMYKVYRGMKIEGQPLDVFTPKEELMNGLRFTLGLYIK